MFRRFSCWAGPVPIILCLRVFCSVLLKNTYPGISNERRSGRESPAPEVYATGKGVSKALWQISTKRFAAASYDDLLRVPWRALQQSLQRAFPSPPFTPSTTRILWILRRASTSSYGSRPLPLPWFHSPIVLSTQGSGFELSDASIPVFWGGRGSRIRTIPTYGVQMRRSEPLRRIHDGVATR